ncbi:MAG: DUF3754 domain-containing protein [Thermoguttaceae bacterium]|jgi:hypothetical protein
MDQMKMLEFLPTRERFLPIRPAVLVEQLSQDPRLSPEERGQFQMLAERIFARFHVDYHRRAEDLKRLLDPLDPDNDMLPGPPLQKADLERCRAELCRAFRRLLLECNYVELPRRQIVQCIELQNYGGVRVEANLDDYADLAVFYRGLEHQTRGARSWRNPWRKKSQACTVFRRAALLIRTTEHPDHVHLKLFKNIVAEDLEMILPRVRVRMRWVERLKISSGVLGSLATAAWKAFTAILLEPVLFAIMLGTFLTAVVRALVNYTTSKHRYLQALSANLYFQNLANNASVLTQLVDSAETEETKEMLLAYFILYVERDRDYTIEALGRRVSRWVAERFGRELDFEVREAVRRLTEKGLVAERVFEERRRPPDPLAGVETAASDPPPRCLHVLKVYDLPSALRRLDKAWDGLYPCSDSQPGVDDRLAQGDCPPRPQPCGNEGQQPAPAGG